MYSCLRFHATRRRECDEKKHLFFFFLLHVLRNRSEFEAQAVAGQCEIRMELRCRSRFSRSRCCSRFEFSYRCYVLWVSYMAIVAMDAHGRCCFPIVTSRGQCPSAIKCRRKLLSN